MKTVLDDTFTRNSIQLLQSGKPYFDLLIKLISEAEESIHIQTYIFNDDETGQSVVNALKIASSKKVKIYILVDGYASRYLSEDFIENLKKQKINFRFFEPLFKNNNFYFGRRLHHKMVVVDSKYALVGGLNVADRYNDCQKIKAWLDYAVLLEGPIANELCILCWKTWNGFKVNKTAVYCKDTNFEFSFSDSNSVLCRMLRNDWVRTKNEISASYQEMFKNAEKQITIICSYFIPGNKAKKLLEFAVAKGVKVRLILANESDVKIAKLAERWMYDWLLRKNIEIYEYQPTVLHAKMCVADEKCVTVGSYNINNISAYASIELNIEIKNELFAKNVTELLDNIITHDCIKITNEVHHKTSTIFKQFYNWAGYRIFRITFFIFTFYFTKQE